MFCKKLGIELDSFSYVEEMNFLDYVWDNIGKEGDAILDDFRKKFGSIGILKPSAVAYSPKKRKIIMHWMQKAYPTMNIIGKLLREV